MENGLKDKVVNEIDKLIEEGMDLSQYDELFEKIKKVHPSLEEEDFFDIMEQQIRDVEATMPKQELKKQPPSKKKSSAPVKKEDDKGVGSSEAERKEMVRETEEVITNAETEEFDKLNDSVELIEKERGDFNIQAYSKIRMQELVEVLSMLVTPQHFVDIKGKKFPTALVSHDIISMYKNLEIQSDDKDIYTPDGDHIIRVKTTVIDHNRNLIVSSSAQDYYKKHVYDPLTKKDRFEIDDRALEKACTRSVRNTMARIIPKKILDMMYQESLKRAKEVTQQKRILSKKSTSAK